MPGLAASRTETPGASTPSSAEENRWRSAFEAAIRDIRVVNEPEPDPTPTEIPKPDPLPSESPKPDPPSTDISKPDPPKPEAPVPDPEVNSIDNVDLRITSNCPEHRTDEFEITDMFEGDYREFLVVRRGQPFNIRIKFNKEYNKEKDDIRLVFQFGKDPRPNRDTHAECKISANEITYGWGAWIKSQTGNVLSLDVITPADCPVGKWTLNVDVVTKGELMPKVERYVHPDPVYILFNPWCIDDQVYFDESDNNYLSEYVLSDFGKIYSGSVDWIGAREWSFGQFSGNVLDCIIKLLDDSELVDSARGDPVLVSRKLSALINSADGTGVLTGNWSGDYKGGTSPLEWTGSTAILEEFWRTGEEVKFGQCWVFSGVLTTACRALGIPARSVTNFASAHDTDGSVTIDNFMELNGDEIDRLNDDSVWNFHVWNDVWMARPDMPQEYWGWQAIDATPQEASDGIYRMGPMSLLAIKRGEVHYPYDGKFVFAEVNADRIDWIRHGDEFYVLNTRQHSVGRFLSTKKPFSYRREDVTDQYKYPEGSAESVEAVRRAHMKSSKKNLKPYKAVKEDVKFEMLKLKEKFIGDTIEATVVFKNTSSEDRTITGTLRVNSLYTTGRKAFNIKLVEQAEVVLKPQEEKAFSIEAGRGYYLDKLKDHCIVSIKSVFIVKETFQTSSINEIQRLKKPHLDVKGPATCVVGETIEIEVSFKNPLYSELTGCTITAEASRLSKPTVYPQENVAPFHVFTGKFSITPSKEGNRKLVIYFNSNELKGITSNHEITVTPKPPTTESTTTADSTTTTLSTTSSTTSTTAATSTTTDSSTTTTTSTSTANASA